jgi:putative SOS response-associated peptidase YedK
MPNIFAMCGRFSLTATPEEVAEIFALLEIEDFPARYNIAPTQPILAIISGETQAPGSNVPSRKAILLRWGLIPGWVKDPNDFPLLINARSETAIGKASFKAAMRHRRILVPASGFYEWHRPEKGSGEKSQAYWVRPKKGGVIALAGLMETWSSADGSEVDTGAILTASSNPSFMPIHDRMPVVIAPEDFSRWLDCKTQEPREVADLMKSADDDFFEAIPVSSLVNKVANTGPELQDPVEPEIQTKPVARKKALGGDGDGQMDLF